jgi:hypothetical protein
VFRRRSSDAAGLLDQDQTVAGAEADNSAGRPRPGFTAPKGVPTPKRSDAQASRRQPYQAPADRKTAARQSRDRNRGDRVRQNQAYQRGEQWALPRKDRGPVRALARDVVDARRSLGEYYMIMVIALVLLLFVGGTTVKLVFEFLVIFLLVVMVVEGWLVGNKVKRLAAQRYPGESTQGVLLYSIMRGISMRRMRVPKPRVNRGDKV